MSGDGDMSPLKASVVQLHEMYVEMKAAGFTRGEAIEILAKVMAYGIGEQVQQENEDD